MIKLVDLLFEQEKILVPRRSKEEREKNHRIVIQKKIQDYIKNGSKGDLNLSNTPIEQLPNNLTKVEGMLSLYKTSIQQLPNNLKVEGSLDLENTPLQQLPNNLKVGGNLYLENTSITSLPNDLEVRRNLDLRNTPISKKYSKEQIEKMVPGVKKFIFV